MRGHTFGQLAMVQHRQVTILHLASCSAQLGGQLIAQSTSGFTASRVYIQKSHVSLCLHL